PYESVARPTRQPSVRSSFRFIWATHILPLMPGWGIGRGNVQEDAVVAGFSVASVLYVWANFDVRVSHLACARPRDEPAAGRGRLLGNHAWADADPSSGGAVQGRRDRARKSPLRRGAAQFPEDRGAPSEFVVRAQGALLHRRGLLPRGRVGQGGERVRGLPALLPPPRDRRPRAVPAGDELLRPDEARRARPGDHAEGDRAVQEAGQGVSAEPLRDRRPREDRQVPRAARAEGSAGRQLRLHAGQPERGAAAARAGAEGLFADRRRPGDALLAG